MKAREIINNLEEHIKREREFINSREVRLQVLTDILHMAKKDRYIAKKETAPSA